MFYKDEKSNVIGLTNYPTNASDKRSSVYIFSLSVPLLFTQKFGHDSKFKFSLGPVVNFNLYGRLCNEYAVGDYTGTIVKGKAAIVKYDNQNVLRVSPSSNVSIIEGFEVDSLAKYTTTFWAKADKDITFSINFL